MIVGVTNWVCDALRPKYSAIHHTTRVEKNSEEL